MKAADLFELPESLSCFGEFFKADAPPWAWVAAIKPALAAFDFDGATGGVKSFPAGVHVSGPVYVHESVQLPPYGVIQGPAYIGPGCQLRAGVFIRGNVIAGSGTVMGNSCEYKNSLLMDNVESAHFNYVGDSVLGNGAHLGAGVILANLKLKRDEVRAYMPEGQRAPTGLRKLGAMLGEGAEVGCNAVLQPGAILGRKAVVMSTLAFAGYVPDGKAAVAASGHEIV